MDESRSKTRSPTESESRVPSFLTIKTDREYFDSEPSEFRDGESEFWFLNKKHRNTIRLGDVVYFWGFDGEQGAFFGWSTISAIREKARPDRRAEKDDCEVEFDQVHRWPTPVTKSTIRESAPELVDLSVMRGLQGSLFRLTPDQARKLNELLRKTDRSAPPDPTADTVEQSVVPIELPPLSDAVQRVVRRAGSLTSKRGQRLTTSLLLYAFEQEGRDALPTTAAGFLSRQVGTVRAQFDSRRQAYVQGLDGGESAEPTEQVSELFQSALGIAQRVNQAKIVSGRHLLAAILNWDEGTQRLGALDRLRDCGIDPPTVRAGFRLSLIRAGFEGERVAWRELLKPRPKTDPTVPGFSTDDPGKGADCLNFTPDYEAMASLLASRTLEPPLAIGVFGNWGSGKSFFMSKLQAQVDSLAKQARMDSRFAFSYWRRIKQIQFNAWHYVDTNLWASLVAHVFDELVKPLYDDPGDPTKQARMDQIKATNIKKQALSAATIQLDAKKEAVKNAKGALDDLNVKLATQSDALAVAVTKGVWETIEQGLNANDKAKLKEACVALGDAANAADDVKALYGKLEDFQTTAGRIRSIGLSMLTNPSAAKIGLLIILLALGVAVWASTYLQHEGVALALRAGGIVSGLAVWISQNAARVSKAIEPLEALRANIAKNLDAVERAKAAEIAKAEQALDCVKTELAQAMTTHATAVHELEESQAELDRLEAGGLISQFVGKRFASDDYRRHLGIVSLVRADLSELSSIVSAYNESPPASEADGIGISRIILYIDDLDRCPSERVVEVLQAIHLLLAFKLFVVVVGVDARWVTHSLAEEYPGMLTVPQADGPKAVAGQPSASPYDYLEKIFQIPYWIPAMNGGSSRELLRAVAGQLNAVATPVKYQPRTANAAGSEPSLPTSQEPQQPEDPLQVNVPETKLPPIPPPPPTAAAAEPRALLLEAVELTAMEELGEILGRSPRAVKRFVNVYRLIRASLPQDEFNLFVTSDPSSSRFRAPMVLLALTVGLPELATELLRSIEAAEDTVALGDLIRKLHSRDTRDPEEGERLRAFASSDQFAQWKNLRVSDLSEWCDRVVQYSFAPPLPPPAFEGRGPRRRTERD